MEKIPAQVGSERVIWIGARHPPASLKGAAVAAGAELVEFPSVEVALKATSGLSVSVAIVLADFGDAVWTIRRLREARSDLQVVAATEMGMPPALALAMKAGACEIADLKNDGVQELAEQLTGQVRLFQKSFRERELLLRLRSLNEEFLKNIVASERRNLELEEQLNPRAEAMVLAEDAPAKILIVDDEEIVRQILFTLLGKGGHQLTLAQNAEEALDAIQATGFNLIVTDKNLPGKSGVELLAEAKKLNPETDVILMTGYASTESAIDALNLGASAYLEKPFDHIQHVRATIDEVLAKQKDRMRKRRYLGLIKEKNRAFLDQYKSIRADLETWLQSKGIPSP